MLTRNEEISTEVLERRLLQWECCVEEKYYATNLLGNTVEDSVAHHAADTQDSIFSPLPHPGPGGASGPCVRSPWRNFLHPLRSLHSSCPPSIVFHLMFACSSPVFYRTSNCFLILGIQFFGDLYFVAFFVYDHNNAVDFSSVFFNLLIFKFKKSR